MAGATDFATGCATGVAAWVAGATALATGATAFATVPDAAETAGVVVPAAIETTPVRPPAHALLIGATTIAMRLTRTAMQTLASIIRNFLTNHGTFEAECTARPNLPRANGEPTKTPTN